MIGQVSSSFFKRRRATHSQRENDIFSVELKSEADTADKSLKKFNDDQKVRPSLAGRSLRNDEIVGIKLE